MCLCSNVAGFIYINEIDMQRLDDLNSYMMSNTHGVYLDDMNLLDLLGSANFGL